MKNPWEILIDWWSWRIWWFYKDIFETFLPLFEFWSVDLKNAWWNFFGLRKQKLDIIRKLNSWQSLSIIFALPLLLLTESYANSVYNGTDLLYELWYPKNILSNRDILITLTSVQSGAFNVLKNIHPNVLWIHNMHKDPVIDRNTDWMSSHDRIKHFQEQFRKQLNLQTVLIISSKDDISNSQISKNTEWWKLFFDYIWYWNIISDISPEDHDRLMSSVQFLSSSMFIMWWLILKKSWIETNYYDTPVSYAIQEMTKRILTQSHLTYQSIATENKFNNEVFDIWRDKIKNIEWSDIESLMISLVYATKETIDILIDRSLLDRDLSDRVNTPISRVRDKILNLSKWNDNFSWSLIRIKILFSDVLELYSTIISNPELLYKKMFDDLRGYFYDYQENQSNLIIDTLTR